MPPLFLYLPRTGRTVSRGEAGALAGSAASSKRKGRLLYPLAPPLRFSA
jgi:hypothetical protein